MTNKRKREKVVAEITTLHLVEFMREQGKTLDQRQAIEFLNENGCAYTMWKHMMLAGENYIKSVLDQQALPTTCASLQ